MRGRRRLDIAPHIGWAVLASAVTALAVAALAGSVSGAAGGGDDRAPVARIAIAALASVCGAGALGSATRRIAGKAQRYPLLDGPPMTVVAMLLLIAWALVVSVSGRL